MNITTSLWTSSLTEIVGQVLWGYLIFVFLWEALKSQKVVYD